MKDEGIAKMRKVIFVLVIALASYCSQADFLYWQVSETDIGSYKNVNMFNLYATKDKGQTIEFVDANDVVGLSTSVDISAFSTGGYSFFIELANYDSTTGKEKAISWSEQIAYTSLTGVTTTLSGITAVAPWHGSNYGAAPEPTSGMLMMVGLALLGLKRRKV